MDLPLLLLEAGPFRLQGCLSPGRHREISPALSVHDLSIKRGFQLHNAVKWHLLKTLNSSQKCHSKTGKSPQRKLPVRRFIGVSFKKKKNSWHIVLVKVTQIRGQLLIRAQSLQILGAAE